MPTKILPTGINHLLVSINNLVICKGRPMTGSAFFVKHLKKLGGIGLFLYICKSSIP